MIRYRVKNNVAMQLMVADFLVSCLQECPPESKADRDAIEAIRERSMSDMCRAIPHLKNFFGEFSPVEFVHALRIVDAQDSAEDDCDYFIRNGANLEMTVELFKIRPEEYRKRREALNLTGVSGGRPKVPEETQRDAIYTDWVLLGRDGGMSLRKKLKSLHEIHSSWSLASIAGALQDCDALPHWSAITQEPEKRSAQLVTSVAISRQARAARAAMRDAAPR